MRHLIYRMRSKYDDKDLSVYHEARQIMLSIGKIFRGLKDGIVLK